MFSEKVFHSWPAILLGACGFAVLFTVAALLGEMLFDGTLRVTRGVVGIGLGAFVGYVVVALLLWREGPASGDA